jgi:hypothetical protein
MLDVNPAHFAGDPAFSNLFGKTIVLSADVVNANAVANTLENVSELSFPVVAGATYTFEFFTVVSVALSSTGHRVTLNGPATSKLFYYDHRNQELFTAYQLPAASATATAPILQGKTFTGLITPSAAGTVMLQMAGEIAATAVTMVAGSYLEYRRVA